MNNLPIRHGEVMLVPIDDIPLSKSKHCTSYIVGHSETGHHHMLKSKTGFEVFMDEATKALYLDVGQDAEIVHRKLTDKHKTLPVAPGKYKVIQKTEYNPWTHLIGKVFD